MSKREVLIIAQKQEDFDHVKAAYPEMDFKDITGLLDPKDYAGFTRVGVSRELSTAMPIETHRRVMVIMPKRESESDAAWKQRTLCHQILSIVTCGFEQVISLTPEDSLIYKEYAEQVKNPADAKP